MMSHITLEITFYERDDAKPIEVIYLIVDAMLPYNIIMG